MTLDWPFWLVGVLLMRAMSRYREFAADRGSALLTGAPEQLMSALEKIGGEEPRGDLRDGAAVSALCIVGTRRGGLFADHPPLEQRLAALAQIGREMGRPVG
jgi:heat shock protein HtpX